MWIQSEADYRRGSKEERGRWTGSCKTGSSSWLLSLLSCIFFISWHSVSSHLQRELTVLCLFPLFFDVYLIVFTNAGPALEGNWADSGSYLLPTIAGLFPIWEQMIYLKDPSEGYTLIIFMLELCRSKTWLPTGNKTFVSIQRRHKRTNLCNMGKSMQAC